MEAIRLVQFMNDCIRRLILVSEEFLKESNLKNFSRVSDFEALRAEEIKLFQDIDEEMKRLCHTMPPASMDAHASECLKSLILENKSLLETLTLIDQKIQINLELEKASIQAELKRYEKETHQLTKFKSTWVSGSGERLDGTI